MGLQDDKLDQFSIAKTNNNANLKLRSDVLCSMWEKLLEQDFRFHKESLNIGDNICQENRTKTKTTEYHNKIYFNFISTLGKFSLQKKIQVLFKYY